MSIPDNRWLAGVLAGCLLGAAMLPGCNRRPSTNDDVAAPSQTVGATATPEGGRSQVIADDDDYDDDDDEAWIGDPGSGDAADVAGGEERATVSDQRLLEEPFIIAVPPPAHQNPVNAVLAVRPDELVAGSRAVLVIAVRTAPMWHIYPMTLPEDSMFIPTSLDLTLPQSISPASNWREPEAHHDPLANVPVLEGEIQFRLLIEVDEHAQPGEVEIVCRFGWQACDPTVCLPPTVTTLTTQVRIVEPPK